MPAARGGPAGNFPLPTPRGEEVTSFRTAAAVGPDDRRPEEGTGAGICRWGDPA